MTNATTTSAQKANTDFSRTATKVSDGAPMVISRLSGWIDLGDRKDGVPAWIVPTRMRRHN